MQTKKVVKSKPKKLGQGHIFDLANVVFPVQKLDDTNQPILDGAGKPVFEDKIFWDFYPFAEFDEIEYGIIINQSCDLENRKAPYLTVGVLEPIDSNVRELLNDEFFNQNFKEFQGTKLYCKDSLIENLSRELDNLIQNKTESNNYHLFFELDRKKRRFFYLNLTKLFPIKGVHYDAILRKVKYQVVGDFQHLIGWKLANLYGRVGVENYAPEQKTKIIEELAPKFIAAISKPAESKFVDVKTTKIFGDIKSHLQTLNNPTAQAQKKENALKKVIEALKSLEEQT